MEDTGMKMPEEKKRTVLLLTVQAVILAATSVTAVTGILNGASSGQDGDNMIGLGYFKAFTMDSNILAGICALFAVFFAARNLRKKEDTTPLWAVVFQFMTSACLFLTMVTVVFFLAPSDVLEGKSYLVMFSDDLLLYHLINPLLACCSFVFLQNRRLKRRDCVWGVLPVAVYTAVYFLMVVVLKEWNDFYGFTFGGRYYLVPVVIPVIFALTCALGYLLIEMNSRAADRRTGKSEEKAG